MTGWIRENSSWIGPVADVAAVVTGQPWIAAAGNAATGYSNNGVKGAITGAIKGEVIGSAGVGAVSGWEGASASGAGIGGQLIGAGTGAAAGLGIGSSANIAADAAPGSIGSIIRGISASGVPVSVNPATGLVSSGPATGMDVGTLLKYGLPLASLALAGSAAGNPFSNTGSAQSALGNIAAATTPAGEALLAEYTSGNLQPGQQQQLDTRQQNETAAVQQYYANAGLSDSSMQTADINKVGNDMMVIKAQLMSTNLSNAISLLGAGSTVYSAIMAQQTAQNTALSSAISNAAGAFSSIFSPSNAPSSSDPSTIASTISTPVPTLGPVDYSVTKP